MTDPEVLALLRDHVAVQVRDFEAAQAARRQKPLDIIVMECVAATATGAAVGFLVGIMVHGFPLYAGYHVPGLIDLWPGRSA